MAPVIWPESPNIPVGIDPYIERSLIALRKCQLPLWIAIMNTMHVTFNNFAHSVAHIVHGRLIRQSFGDADLYPSLILEVFPAQ